MVTDGAGVERGLGFGLVDAELGGEPEGVAGVVPRIQADGCHVPHGDGAALRRRDQLDAEAPGLLEEIPEERAGEVVEGDPVGLGGGEGVAGGAVEGPELGEPAVVARVEVEAIDLVGERAPGDVRLHERSGCCAHDGSHGETAEGAICGALAICAALAIWVACCRARDGPAPPVVGARGELAHLELQPHRRGGRDLRGARLGESAHDGLPAPPVGGRGVGGHTSMLPLVTDIAVVAPMVQRMAGVGTSFPAVIGSDVPAGNRVEDAPLAQLDRASDYGSEGQGFESLRAHKKCKASVARSVVIART